MNVHQQIKGVDNDLQNKEIDDEFTNAHEFSQINKTRESVSESDSDVFCPRKFSKKKKLIIDDEDEPNTTTSPNKNVSDSESDVFCIKQTTKNKTVWYEKELESKKSKWLLTGKDIKIPNEIWDKIFDVNKQKFHTQSYMDEFRSEFSKQYSCLINNKDTFKKKWLVNYNS